MSEYSHRECLVHGADCLHCGEACRLELEILRKQLSERDEKIRGLEEQLSTSLTQNRQLRHMNENLHRMAKELEER